MVSIQILAEVTYRLMRLPVKTAPKSSNCTRYTVQYVGSRKETVKTWSVWVPFYPLDTMLARVLVVARFLCHITTTVLVQWPAVYYFFFFWETTYMSVNKCIFFCAIEKPHLLQILFVLKHLSMKDMLQLHCVSDVANWEQNDARWLN